MYNTPEQFILGSKKEHFVISSDTIWCITKDIRDYLIQQHYTGPINICFPGCELITNINNLNGLEYQVGSEDQIDEEDQVGENPLKYISSIDLSKMLNLQYISYECFACTGYENKDFSEINISCPNLVEIKDSAFANVGAKSKYVNLILNCPNLLTIGSRAFAEISGSVTSVTNKFIPNNFTFDLSTCPKLHKIGYAAFSEYCYRMKTKHTEIILPDNIEIIERDIFDKAFGFSENITINISNKPLLKCITKEAFRRGTQSMKIIVSNCPQLTEIGSMDRQTIYSFEIDINSCPKLQTVFNISAKLFCYYKSIGKLEGLLNGQVEIVKQETNLQNVINQLQQQIDLQKQIIQEQAKLFQQLKNNQIINIQFGILLNQHLELPI